MAAHDDCLTIIRRTQRVSLEKWYDDHRRVLSPAVLAMLVQRCYDLAFWIPLCYPTQKLAQYVPYAESVSCEPGMNSSFASLLMRSNEHSNFLLVPEKMPQIFHLGNEIVGAV